MEFNAGRAVMSYESMSSMVPTWAVKKYMESFKQYFDAISAIVAGVFIPYASGAQYEMSLLEM